MCDALEVAKHESVYLCKSVSWWQLASIWIDKRQIVLHCCSNYRPAWSCCTGMIAKWWYHVHDVNNESLPSAHWRSSVAPGFVLCQPVHQFGRSETTMMTFWACSATLSILHCNSVLYCSALLSAFLYMTPEDINVAATKICFVISFLETRVRFTWVRLGPKACTWLSLSHTLHLSTKKKTNMKLCFLNLNN